MTSVDDTLLAKLEKLSSLKVEDSKREKMKQDIGSMIDFVQNLNEIDVSGVEATFSTITGGTPLREDIVKTDIELSNHILKHAPKSEDGYFIVPKIIE